MLTDDDAAVAVRDRLANELSDLQVGPELVAKIRSVVHLRQRRRVMTGIVAFAAVIVALAPFAFNRSSPQRNRTALDPGHLTQSSVRLDGFRFISPTGYEFDGANDATCKSWFIPAGSMPPPGFVAIENQSFASLASTSTGGAGCVRVANSATYAAGLPSTSLPNDPVAPNESQSIMVGPYHAAMYAVPGQGVIAAYVQIPTPGGGFHDLLVASQGMAGPDLELMLAKALPQTYQAVPIKSSGG
jgi:hypothetical protein